MSSLAKRGRVIRSAAPEGDEGIFVLGHGSGRSHPGDSVLATAGALVESSQRQADQIVADAYQRATAIVAEAEASAGSVRGAAYDDGYQAGRQQAGSEIEECVNIARRAANEGKVVRDELAAQAASVVARAVSLALRRITGEYYEGDPSRTTSVVAEALRAAAGQEILSIRVNAGLVEAVTSALSDVASYVRADDSIAIGGCVIDVRNGTIDASLDARLDLMDLALRQAGGEASL
jgi:flagellar assembly protein FliH